MPFNPQQGDLHVDQMLTNISIAYKNMDYIADQIFPIVPVQRQSNIVPKYDQSYWFRDDADLRAPGTKSKGNGFTVDTSQKYFCDRYSFRFEVADEQRDNTDAPFDLDRDGAFFTTDKLQLRRERAFAADFFATSKWGTDKVGITDFNQWSVYGASSPLMDLTTYMDTVESLIGKEPNTFIMGKQVWVQLKWHPDLIDQIKYTQTGKITEQILTSLSDLTRILIGRAIVTTTADGTAEASVTYSRIWGKNGLLLYVPSSPSLQTPAAGYTFVWQRVPNSIQYVKRFRDEEREVDIIEANSYFDQAITASNAGLFLSAVVA